MAFNAGRAKQSVAQLCHQRQRDINIQSAVGNRAGKALHILRGKVAKMRPPVKNFGERVRFNHHVNRIAFES
ncbi:hypothetical protein D3C80_1348090 [compost metagenome]